MIEYSVSWKEVAILMVCVIVTIIGYAINKKH